MIQFTRLTGGAIAINPDLIERAEETPDTVITLVDDKKFLVQESLEQVMELIRDYRSYVIARAQSLEVVDVPRPRLQVIPNDTVVSLHAVADGDAGPSYAADERGNAASGPGDTSSGPGGAESTAGHDSDPHRTPTASPAEEQREGRRAEFLQQLAAKTTEQKRWTP